MHRVEEELWAQTPRLRNWSCRKPGVRKAIHSPARVGLGVFELAPVLDLLG